MICILSDTHDNKHSAELAAAAAQELDPQVVIHCGDICAPYMLEYFTDLPFSFVFGNCDWDKDGLTSKAKQLGIEQYGYSIELEIGGKRIFVHHGDNDRLLDSALATQSFDYIFHGHTHEQSDHTEGRTRVINPGALHRAAVYSYGVLEPESGSLEYREIPKG